MLTHILPLQEHLCKMLKDENSIDMALPLANLFITFGESHTNLLIEMAMQSEEGKQCATKLVYTILQVI